MGENGLETRTRKDEENKEMKPYYQDDFCTIYHGDCAEVLPEIGKVWAVVTDPPYGIGESSKRNASRTKPFGSKTALSSTQIKAKDYGEFAWDDQPPALSLLTQLRAISDYQIIFGGNYFELPPTSCILVWDKDNSGDFADCELAWTNLKIAVRKLTYRWNGCIQETAGAEKELRVHPTQKPLAVMKWAMGFLPRDPGVICDPFMGSGTTLIAARALGCESIGIERDERYCELAVKRLSGKIGLTVGQEKNARAREAGQLDLFKRANE